MSRDGNKSINPADDWLRPVGCRCSSGRLLMFVWQVTEARPAGGRHSSGR